MGKFLLVVFKLFLKQLGVLYELKMTQPDWSHGLVIINIQAIQVKTQAENFG